MYRIAGLAFAATLGGSALVSPAPCAPERLKLEEVGSDSTAFDVVATMIVGPTELVVWDAQYHRSDANRLADRIAATGKKLTAIVLSHPDHDHYMGVASLLARFPGTPVYLSAAGIEEFKATAANNLKMEKARFAAEAPDSTVTPAPLPATLTVDGVRIEVIPDLTGDSGKPLNSVLWIPSLRAALVSDLAFNGVHPWLGASTEASRAAWLASIERVKQLEPKVVVPGHKKDVGAADTPEVLSFMTRYLTDFDALRKSSTGPDQLFAAMRDKYPDLAVAGLLRYGARVAFNPPQTKAGTE